MGNWCFTSSTQDDISLLRESEGITANESHNANAPPPPYQERAPQVFHPATTVSQTATQLTADEQLRIVKRIGLINHLPSGIYDGSKKARECVICMNEFVVGDAVRYLPCVHTYHQHCIDDWLMRSFTCPSCMEPVDAALLMTYETN
jgi:E3 ubiquitin-protein ligase RNF11